MSGPQRAATRPLSPHLQVWRFHATMLSSITHRVTGMALYFGTFLIAAWLIALANGPEAYSLAESVITSIFGKVVLFFWAAAVLFHFANGLRHLLWDGPRVGFSPKTANQVSIFNYVFAIIGAAALIFLTSGF